MGIHVDSSEVGHLALDLAKAPGTVQRRASQAIRKTAQDITRDAQALCPVDTGNLRNSIGATVGLLEAEVGPTAHYGGYVELGTSRMSPQPYLRPAFDRRAPGLVQALGQAVEDIL